MGRRRGRNFCLHLDALHRRHVCPARAPSSFTENGSWRRGSLASELRSRGGNKKLQRGNGSSAKDSEFNVLPATGVTGSFGMSGSCTKGMGKHGQAHGNDAPKTVRAGIFLGAQLYQPIESDDQSCLDECSVRPDGRTESAAALFGTGRGATIAPGTKGAALGLNSGASGRSGIAVDHWTQRNSCTASTRTTGGLDRRFPLRDKALRHLRAGHKPFALGTKDAKISSKRTKIPKSPL